MASRRAAVGVRDCARRACATSIHAKRDAGERNQTSAARAASECKHTYARVRLPPPYTPPTHPNMRAVAQHAPSRIMWAFSSWNMMSSSHTLPKYLSSDSTSACTNSSTASSFSSPSTPTRKKSDAYRRYTTCAACAPYMPAQVSAPTQTRGGGVRAHAERVGLARRAAAPCIRGARRRSSCRQAARGSAAPSLTRARVARSRAGHRSTARAASVPACLRAARSAAWLADAPDLGPQGVRARLPLTLEHPLRSRPRPRSRRICTSEHARAPRARSPARPPAAAPRQNGGVAGARAGEERARARAGASRNVRRKEGAPASGARAGARRCGCGAARAQRQTPHTPVNSSAPTGAHARLKGRSKCMHVRIRWRHWCW